MGQNKLENQIKEQLNAREIKPTEMAWDRLDAMLSVAEEKKSKKGFGWMSIAAVFIGLLLTGFVIFQLNSSKKHGSGTDFLKALTKTANMKARLLNMTEEDFDYATKTLNSNLMQLFHYKHPHELL